MKIASELTDRRFYNVVGVILGYTVLIFTIATAVFSINLDNERKGWLNEKLSFYQAAIDRGYGEYFTDGQKIIFVWNDKTVVEE